MTTRSERIEAAARALVGCNSRAPIGPNESSEWVAVSAEHLDALRAALATSGATPEVSPGGTAPEPEWVVSSEGAPVGCDFVHRRGLNRPDKFCVSALESRRLCDTLNHAHPPAAPDEVAVAALTFVRRVAQHGDGLAGVQAERVLADDTRKARAILLAERRAAEGGARE